MAQPRYKARYAWKAVANKGHSTGTADLDHNWRASATGLPSDHSSNSGTEAGDRTGQWRNDPLTAEKKSALGEGEQRRSDRDTNWREHKTQTQSNPTSAGELETITSLPPSGCKKSEKNQVNRQRSADKGEARIAAKVLDITYS